MMLDVASHNIDVLVKVVVVVVDSMVLDGHRVELTMEFVDGQTSC